MERGRWGGEGGEKGGGGGGGEREVEDSCKLGKKLSGEGDREGKIYDSRNMCRSLR